MSEFAELFKTEWDGEVLVLEIRGYLESLSSVTYEQILTHVVNLVEAQSEPRLVIDTSSLQLADSSVAALIVMLWKELLGRNGKVVLAAPSPTFREALRFSRLDTVWPIYDTREEAVTEIRKTV